MIALFIFIGGIIMNDTKRIGNLTELQCITRLYELGYSISIPYGDSEKYDFILDVNGNLYKIQCKHANIHRNEYGLVDYVSIDATWQSGYTKGNKFKRNSYSKDEVDYFATYYEGKVYLIPVENCSAQKILRILPPKNNQSKGITYLINYADETICKTM